MKNKPGRDSSLGTFGGQVQVCVTGLYMGGCAGHELENARKLFRDFHGKTKVTEMTKQFSSSMVVTTEHQLENARFQKMRMEEVEETVAGLLEEFYKLSPAAVDTEMLAEWRRTKGVK